LYTIAKGAFNLRSLTGGAWHEECINVESTLKQREAQVSQHARVNS